MSTETVGGFAHMLDERGRPVREPIALHYNSSDPLAIELTFSSRINPAKGEALTWVFARDLARAGLERHSGIGDVRVWPSNDGLRLHIVLDSPEGYGHGWLPATLVRLFLARADKLVPPSTEVCDVDGAIAGCLAGRPWGGAL